LYFLWGIAERERERERKGEKRVRMKYHTSTISNKSLFKKLTNII